MLEQAEENNEIKLDKMEARAKKSKKALDNALELDEKLKKKFIVE